VPADSLLQKLIHLDVLLLRNKECDPTLRNEIMEAQQDVLNMQAEMLRLLKEIEQLRQQLALVTPKAVPAKARRFFVVKAS
jgi:hypothetical protein